MLSSITTDNLEKEILLNNRYPLLCPPLKTQI